MGTVRGTSSVFELKFREKAQLATGLMSIVAGSLFEHGAHGFRIGIAMRPEEAYGRGQYLYWREDDKSLVTSYRSSRARRLVVDPEMRARIETSPVGRRAASIIESGNRTELEEAIAKSLHWYSDAHRDDVMVMRFIKYWSCVEVYFSSKPEKITASVSIGLSAVLCHGCVEAFPPEEYSKLRKRIVEMYRKRSKATHRANFDHVKERDVADLSQWVSWLILNSLVLAESGFRSTSEMNAWADSEHQRRSPRWTQLRALAQRIYSYTNYFKAFLRRVFSR
jgi:hypothetical protein